MESASWRSRTPDGVLEPDLAELFPDNESVNAALRKVSARRLAAPRKKTR